MTVVRRTPYRNTVQNSQLWHKVTLLVTMEQVSPGSCLSLNAVIRQI